MEVETTGSETIDGRTAIITGGGGSIGTFLSVKLALEGANVVIAQRSADSAEEVVQRIRELGGEAMFVQTDMSDQADVRATVDETIDQYDGVEIVVNNAANPKKALAESMDSETWEEIIDTNLTGSFQLAQAAYEYMERAEYGRIINIGAIQSYSPLPGGAAYAASKAGLEGLTRSLAVEWSSPDITVNTVHVGPVYGGDWTDEVNDDVPVEQRYERVPADVDEEAATLVDRIGRPSDIAELVSFLASPASGFITGQTITCDGGRLISRDPEPFDQQAQEE